MKALELTSTKAAEDLERSARKLLSIPRKGVPFFGMTATGPRSQALLDEIEKYRLEHGDDAAAIQYLGTVAGAYACALPEDPKEVKEACTPAEKAALYFPVTDTLETKARADSAKPEATPDADAVCVAIDTAKEATPPEKPPAEEPKEEPKP